MLFSKQLFLVIALLFIVSVVESVTIILDSYLRRAFETESRNLVLQFPKTSKIDTKQTFPPTAQALSNKQDNLRSPALADSHAR